MQFNERKAYILLHSHRVISKSAETHVLRAWRVERFDLDKPKLIGYALTHQAETTDHMFHEYYSEIHDVGNRMADLIQQLKGTTS